jgi:glucosamine kinase
MPLYIGIDGGGTKTACALGDADTVLSTSRSAGSNVVRLGEERAGIALREAISQACWSAGVSPLSIEAVCVGASGAGRPEVQQKVQSWVRRVADRRYVFRQCGDEALEIGVARKTDPVP